MTNLTSVARSAVVGQATGPELRKVDKAAQDMEAGFLKQLVQMMRKSNPEVKFGDQLGGSVYEDLFDQAVSESLAKGAPLGIGKMVAKGAAKQIAATADSDYRKMAIAFANQERAALSQRTKSPTEGNQEREKGLK